MRNNDSIHIHLSSSDKQELIQLAEQLNTSLQSLVQAFLKRSVVQYKIFGIDKFIMLFKESLPSNKLWVEKKHPKKHGR